MSKNRAKGDPSGDALLTRPAPRRRRHPRSARRRCDRCFRQCGQASAAASCAISRSIAFPASSCRSTLAGPISWGTGPTRASRMHPDRSTWRCWRCSSQRLREAVRECAAAEVGCAVIMTTGFAELGEAGRRVQDELVNIARAAGHAHRRAELHGTDQPAPCFGADLLACSRGGRADAGRNRPHQPERRAHGLDVRLRAQRRHRLQRLRLARQPERSREICDFLEHMIEDAKSRAICLYVEGFKAPRRFLELACRCRERGKPLLMVKAGRTEAGVRAALSHTASLAAGTCRARGRVPGTWGAAA